jgi:hypothetical protein
MLRTQIGGKYHPDDDSVFRLKRRLTGLGVTVSHPIADSILALGEAHGFAFDPAEHSFADVERDYYESIRRCDVHVVANQFGSDLGYIGGSASQEMAFAMLHARPIVVLHPGRLTAGVDPAVRQILEPRYERLVVCDLLAEPEAVVQERLHRLVGHPVDYGLIHDEHSFIATWTREFLGSLKAETTDAATSV